MNFAIPLGFALGISIAVWAALKGVEDGKNQIQHQLHVACLESGRDWIAGKCVKGASQ